MKRLAWRRSGILFAIAVQCMGLSSVRADESNILDFEADVIEGEKRKPDLFLQMEGSSNNLDAILYSREDFNDYHELDRRWRPRFRKMKGKTQ